VSRSRVTLPMERNARETASRSPSPPRISALPTSLVTVAGQSRRDCIVQPRVARHELPWEDHVKAASTPTGLHRRCPRVDTTPLGLTGHSNILTQGSSCLATLGLKIESLRDSQGSCLELWVMLSPRRGREFAEQNLSRFEPLNHREGTSNIQHPTSNVQGPSFGPLLDVGRSMLDVGCSPGSGGGQG